MKATLPILATALCTLPLAGLAQDANDELSYTYLEVDWLNLDIDAFDDGDLIEDFDDGDGWGVQGSFAFTPAFFMFAGYSDTEADATFFNDDNFLITESEDVQILDVGLGVNVPVGLWARPTDFVGRASYVDVDYGDFNFGGTGDDDLDDLDDDSSDGWRADARLRSQVTERVEASLGAAYLDIEEADGFSIVGNALIELTPAFGINLEANIGDDVSWYLAGVRYSFDRF
jgi:hypothetical protein